jgi:hypothetical protein
MTNLGDDRPSQQDHTVYLEPNVWIHHAPG